MPVNENHNTLSDVRSFDVRRALTPPTCSSFSDNDDPPIFSAFVCGDCGDCDPPGSTDCACACGPLLE